MTPPVEIRDGTVEDGEHMLALMPRLADFRLPDYRKPGDLYADDEKLLRKWLAGEAEQCLVQVAEDMHGFLGFTLTTLKPEALSKKPSAHLEAIAVDKRAEGRGIATALLLAAETNARNHGACFMTLHVFATNERARGVYEHSGYEAEILRYMKPLGETAG